ncbi:Hypothetical protein B591_11576 [Streptomyces sp. GBA 94-10 4N24]|nr:Hypothetical protein B591_11576 [Streptomyces sp. GBA 94-10 4N24]UZN59302.1 Hypothetical protein B591N_11576 [Streptomyces sp. GBA 94-10 4N24]
MEGGQRGVLVAIRSAVALHRLLDVLPVFDRDDRVRIRFTLVPGSRFDVDALTALDRTGARTMPWQEACSTRHDLVLTASPKGDLHLLPGPRALLPHGAGFGKALGDGLGGGALGAGPRPPAGRRRALGRPARPGPRGAGAAAGPVLSRGPPRRRRRRPHRRPPAALPALPRGVPRGRRHRPASAGRPLLGLGPRITRRPPPRTRRRAARPPAPRRLPGRAGPAPQRPQPDRRLHLARWMAPALRAGLVPARPHEEWAALLVAADAVVTDHGSTGLHAAALGRPVVGVYDGGHELSVFSVATDRVTVRSGIGVRNGQGSRAVEGGVRRLNSTTQEPCWFRILPHSTCLTPWSSGSRCSSSPVKVTAGANSRRTVVR